MNRYMPLFEKFFDAGEIGDNYFELFLNPTSKELKECGAWTRGIITPAGDMYVAKDFKQNSFWIMIHIRIIRELAKRGIIRHDQSQEKNWWLDPFIHDYLGVIQYNDMNEFFLSENYGEKIDEEYVVERYLEPASKKNPYIIFYPIVHKGEDF